MQIELSLCSHLVKAKCNDDLYEIFEANKVIHSRFVFILNSHFDISGFVFNVTNLGR